MKPLSLKERLSLERFLQGENEHDNQAIELTQRRIFILPNHWGLGFGVLVLLLALIAFVYSNNLAYMLTFLLASIFFITILHTYKSMAGLVVQEGQTKPVFAGEMAGFSLMVDNPTAIERSALQLKFKNHTVLFSLNPHSNTVQTVYDKTVVRGWHPAGTLTLFSTYPLGLFRAWSPMRLKNKVLVYPKPIDQHLPFPQTLSPGQTPGFSFQHGDEFYGLNPYQPGDPIRQIHWKSYAKGLGLFTKQHAGEGVAEIWLDYQAAPGHTVEERLSCLCRWVVDAEQLGLAYGFVLSGVRIPPNRGQAHYHQCLAALALF